MIDLGYTCHSFYLSTDSFLRGLFFPLLLTCIYHCNFPVIKSSYFNILLLLLLLLLLLFLFFKFSFHNHFSLNARYCFNISSYYINHIFKHHWKPSLNCTAEHQLWKTQSRQYFVELASNINKKELRPVVGFNNDDLWMMMQLLIPNRGSLYSDTHC